LAVETTGVHLGLALWTFDPSGRIRRRRRTVFQRKPLQASDLFFPTLTRLLKSVGLKKSDLHLLAVDVGPGSFTGVRVGVSAARALAQGLNVPLVSVLSLEALAWQAKSPAGRPVLSWMRALPGEAYFGVYARPASPPKKGFPLATLREARWGRDEEAERLKTGLRQAVLADGAPHPDAIAELGIARYEEGGGKSASFSFERAVPVYLQPSWAERNAR
jgi:tRNA threonylcarbamoyl adenosine modification protein YeaZ